MSYLKLFRKEALRKQYKSQEFGETVIEQPILLHKFMLGLLVLLVLFSLLALSVPFTSKRQLATQLHEANFTVVVSPRPVVVEKHLLPDTSFVAANQAVSQIRYFPEQSQKPTTEMLHSNEIGFYFSAASSGTVVPAFEPIARILLKNPEQLYFFWVSDLSPDLIKPGKEVMLVLGGKKVSGLVQSVTGPYQQNRLNVGIRLRPPFDESILNPAVVSILELPVQRSNFVDLLRGASR